MKKIIILMLVTAFILPAFSAAEESKEQRKHRLKIEKIKRKQEIKCLKNPSKCPIQTNSQNLTLGLVQNKIKIGSTQAEVAKALGSPNIVTNDVNGSDTWIYDKIASSYFFSSSGISSGVGGLIAGVNTDTIGANTVGIGYSNAKERYSSSQKTLTVVIKFNSVKKVESISYHMTSF